jgi:hypothetical protein
MEFFSPSELLSKGTDLISNKRRTFGSIYESDASIMAKDASAFNSLKTYDVFLSHSFSDATIIYGLKGALEENGFSAYVYWIEDKATESQVTPETAERLKDRMKVCRSLLYATSENAENSKWMPWELGYFDGTRGKVAVCPITQYSSFNGREYLGLYPIMEKDLWLHKDGKLFKKLRTWIDES